MAAEYMDGRSAVVRSVEIEYVEHEGVPSMRILAAGSGEVLAIWRIADIRYEDPQVESNAIVHLFHRTQSGAMVSAPPGHLPPEIAMQTRSAWYGPFLRGYDRRYFVPLIVFVAVSFAAAYWGFPMLASWLAKRTPVEWETRLSHGFIEALFDSDRALKGPPDAALKKIVSRLSRGTPDARYPYRVILVPDPIVNAFAIPGGVVVMTCGFVRQADSPEEVAGVLAHEMQHTISRHVLAGVIRGAALTTFWNMALGDFSGALAVDPEMVLTLASLRFRKSDEAEADAGAFRILDRSGIATFGIRAFFEKMSRKEGEQGSTAKAMMTMLRTHPDTGERVALFSQGRTVSIEPVLHPEEWDALRGGCDSENFRSSASPGN